MSGARRMARGYVDAEGTGPVLDLEAGRARLAGTDGSAARAAAQARRRLPVRPGRDCGADGPARGPVEPASVEVDGTLQGVLIRARGVWVTRLEPGLQETARAYAALVERATSVAAPGEGLPIGYGGGVSDGGAVTRCATAQRLSACRRAIGAELLRPAPQAGAGARAIEPGWLLDRLAVDGWPIHRALRARGWSAGRRAERRLSAAAEGALRRVQRVIG